MIGDTIVACASAPGSSERAVLRLSGPTAIPAAAGVFTPALSATRAVVSGQVSVRGHGLPAFALVMPGPGSFTGEDVVELHVPGSPLLVQFLLDQLVHDGAARGVRLAVPGEFTARAVTNGRLDACRVEGLLMLLHSSDAAATRAALPWLRGDLGRAVAAVRGELQDLLAELEARLDFSDEEIGVASGGAQAERLDDLWRRTAGLLASVPVAVPGGSLLLHGRSNAGKSALVNALAGRSLVLVDSAPGTTRDVLQVEIAPQVFVYDAPGDLDAPVGLDADAIALRDELAGMAAARLCVVDATCPMPLADGDGVAALPVAALVWTKVDLTAPPAAPAWLPTGTPVFATSARTGAGIDALRAFVQARGPAGVVDAGGPLRSGLQAANDAIGRARQAAQSQVGEELLAVDVQAALRALDGLVGSHGAEQVLDRIYQRFCLGK